MKVTIQCEIDDTLWPKLKIAGHTTDVNGTQQSFTAAKQYDLAYGCFENALHNQLRSAIGSLMAKRKPPKEYI